MCSEEPKQQKRQLDQIEQNVLLEASEVEKGKDRKTRMAKQHDGHQKYRMDLYFSL